MARIDIRGVMVPDDYKCFYDYFKMDSTCPKDVRSILENKPGEVHDVYINSPGGVIDVGSEIYTMLREYRPGIKIKIVGEACSAASVAAMAGYCEMSPTALMMIHCVSSGVRGNHADMEKCAELLKKADRALCQAYTAKSGMTEQEVLRMMEETTWLTAEQALSYGLIDRIMFHEEQEMQRMTALYDFELPSREQLEEVKKAAGQHAAFQEAEAQAKIHLLKLKVKGNVQ